MSKQTLEKNVLQHARPARCGGAKRHHKIGRCSWACMRGATRSAYPLRHMCPTTRLIRRPWSSVRRSPTPNQPTSGPARLSVAYDIDSGGASSGRCPCDETTERVTDPRITTDKEEGCWPKGDAGMVTFQRELTRLTKRERGEKPGTSRWVSTGEGVLECAYYGPTAKSTCSWTKERHRQLTDTPLLGWSRSDRVEGGDDGR